MRTSWVIVILDIRSTVDTSAESSGAVNLLSDSDLTGIGVHVCSTSVTIVAFVANGNIWISRCLSLADPKGPW